MGRATFLPGAYLRRLAAVVAGFALLMPATGQAEQRRVGLTGFDRVEISGNVEVRIIEDHRLFALVTGDGDTLDSTQIAVENRVLVIRPVTNGRFGRPRGPQGPVTIEVHAQNLRAIALRGTARAEVARLRGPNVQVQLNGSGAITVAAIDAPDVATRLEGAGRITLAGNTRQLVAGVTGAGGIDAANLRADRLRAALGGSGSSSFSVVRAADLLVAGDASVSVTGRGRCTVRNSSRGEVSCAGGITQTEQRQN